MQTAPDPRAELERLRKMKRLRELEAKAGAPSLRSETDAIIEEAAAAIPGGFAAFDAKPADPQRMAAMGYVADPLAKSGYARPQAQQPRMADTGNTNSLIADVARGLEAPVRGLTGGGLEGWARTTQADPLRGAVEAVDFISPVDDLGRAYQGAKQAGAGLIEGDMAKAGEGAQQLAIDGSFAALQMLPGSMAARGLNVPKNTLALNVADLERAAMQATRAPPVGKPAPQAAAPQPQPAPFSAPAEPKASGFLRNNADRIVGGGVGAFAGSAGDALAAPGDGNESGGPDIINPATGAVAGMLAPRFAGQAWRSGRRASMPPAQRAAYDQRVAYKVLRNALAPAGIKSAEQGIAALTARYGDKPASIVDLAQGNVGLAANLSRQQGATGEAALARGEQLLGGRAGRLERDIGQAAPGLNPGAITGDVDRMIALAQEQAKPAYDALKQQFPEGSVQSQRLSQIEGIGPHIKAVDEYRAATKANEGRAVSDFEYWDLVKRDIDAKEQQLIAAGATMDDIRVRKLEGARAALVTELDDLMKGYAEARQLGGEAPKMREAFKQGQKLLDGNFLADEVSNMIREVTGQQLTATQAGVIRNMMKKTQSGRTAMAALMSSDARKKLEAVFGREAAEALQARFAADAAIMTNAQRVSPNVGSVSAQALLGEGGGVQQAAELAQQAVAFKTNPLAAVLGALSRSGAYSQAQRDIMGELLLSDDVAGSLNRIFSNRPPRNALNVEPPPAPTGPPTNALTPRRPEQAGFGGNPTAGEGYTFKHLDAIKDRLAREQGRLGEAKTAKEREFRAVQVSQVEKELANEIAFLKSKGITPPDEMSIDELAAGLEGFDGASMMRGNPEALGAAGGAAIGMATAPDQNGDGVVDAQERMLGGAGGALTGGIAGRAMFRGGDRGAIGGGPQAQGFGGKGKPSTFIANTKATKPMATEFDGVDIQMPSDKSGTGRVAIKSERGDGEITFTLNERGDYVVKESSLDADMRGQGLGVKMYEALAQRAAASRRAMYSDSLVSGDAVKIYMALKRRGYNVRLANPDDVAENPNFRPSTWDENKNVLFPAGPKSKPGTIVASPSDPSVFKVTKYGIPAVGGGSLIVIMEPDAET